MSMEANENRIAPVMRRLLIPGRGFVVVPADQAVPVPMPEVRIIPYLLDLMMPVPMPMERAQKVAEGKRLLCYCSRCEVLVGDVAAHCKTGGHDLKFLWVPDLRRALIV